MTVAKRYWSVSESATSALMSQHGYVPRLIDGLLDELLLGVPAVLVVGPRASGKTTTARRAREGDAAHAPSARRWSVRSQFGKQLGDGLCEFRLRYDLAELLHRFEGKEPESVRASPQEILFRVFFHAYGDKIVLLLHGYDKSRRPPAAPAAARDRRGPQAPSGLSRATTPT